MIIYKVTNKINGKIYIGQTVQSLNCRKSSHFSDSRNGNKDAMPFHRALLKYGINNFKWEIIHRCKNKMELDFYEIYYIRELRASVSKFGYNVSIGGGNGRLGLKSNKETILKMVKSKTGKKLNLTKEERKRRSDSIKGTNNPSFKCDGKHHNQAKEYLITTPYGEEIKVNGLRRFCRSWKKDKLYHNNLSLVANGRMSHYKGYKCEHLEVNNGY